MMKTMQCLASEKSYGLLFSQRPDYISSEQQRTTNLFPRRMSRLRMASNRRRNKNRSTQKASGVAEDSSCGYLCQRTFLVRFSIVLQEDRRIGKRSFRKGRSRSLDWKSWRVFLRTPKMCWRRTWPTSRIGLSRLFCSFCFTANIVIG